MLSVSNKTVSKWENGISEPSLSVLTKLAKYYNVSTDYILGLSNESKHSTKTFIHSEINSHKKSEVCIKSFDLICKILPTCFDIIGKQKNR